MKRRGMVAAAMAALLAGPGLSETPSGAYLAARQAAAEHDYPAAARYFAESLRGDPANPQLLEGAMAAHVALGALDRAAPVARDIVAAGIDSQVANLTLLAANARREDWDAIFAALETGREISPLVDGLSQGWAALGQGDMDRALENFDAVIAVSGMGAYGLYHKALAMALVGDYEGAETLFEGLNARGIYSPRAALAHIQILTQLEKFEAANAVLEAAFGQATAPIVSDMAERIASREPVPFDVIDTPRAGMGEVFHMVTTVLRGETPDSYTLLYARLAEALNPRNTQATLLVAELLEGLGRYKLAGEDYGRIAVDDPAYLAAELGRINVLQRADRGEAAAEAADALARAYPDNWAVHNKRGDVLRVAEDYAGAYDAYSRALDLMEDDRPGRWTVHYLRAIVAHKLDDWPAAEADFRAALALEPQNASVLNYLGYSLVERGEKMDEALDMIERAVAAQPANGAIVDSLGWVLFKMGQYEDAVGYLEDAAALEAVDPIVNDHLGDAYWAVGRRIEAHFQWNRALSFDPDPELADRIRRKLEIGLDAVLEEENREPLAVANDDT